MKYYLKYIVEQNQEIMEELLDFKKTVNRRLDELQDEQDKLKGAVTGFTASLSNINEDTKNKSDGFVKLLDTGFNTVVNGIKVAESNQVHISKQIKEIPFSNTRQEEPSAERVQDPQPKQPDNHKVRNCAQCDFMVHSDQHLKKHMKVRHGVRDKMLWVGDTISSNADFKHISDISNTVITTVKAYAVSQEESAGCPEKNFLDVVEKELEDKGYTFLVLGGGTVEITNLDTKSNPEEGITRFKETVIRSSTKLFTLAEAALHTNPSLEKVIILRRPPRFDPVVSDPMELKPQLSRLGDAVLFDLWCESRFKEKIFLGDHQIPHQLGPDHEQVFGHPNHTAYDGIQMGGPGGRKCFQESILNILNNAGIIKLLNDTRTQIREENIPSGLKPAQPSSKGYDPMRMFRERLTSARVEEPAVNVQTPQSTSNPNQTQNPPDHPRPSVINRSSTIQSNYSVPVSNSFGVLGN